MTPAVIGTAAPSRAHRSEAVVFFRFLRWLLPVWDKALLVLLIGIASTTLSVIPAWIMKFFVDEAVPDRNVNVFFAVFAAYIGMDLLNRLVDTTSSIISRWVDLRVGLALRRHFFGHLLRLSPTFLQSRPVGEQMYRASEDITAVMGMITDTLPSAIRAVYEFALVLLLTSFLSPLVTLAILAYAIPYTLVTHWFATRIRHLDRTARERGQERDAGLQQGLAGVATVKAYGRTRQEVLYQNHLTIRAYRAGASLFWFKDILQGRVVGDLLPWLKTQALRAFFLREVILGRLTYGSVFPILDYTSRLTNPITRIISLIQQTRIAMVPAERLLETLDVAPAVTDHPNARSLPPLRGEIRFENVTFRYDEGREILSDISFTIASGKTVAIVGPSGAGKSTVAALLLRLHDPTMGRVLADGHDLRDVRLTSYQEQIGFVLQETYLFQGTLRDNLLYAARGEVAEAELEAALARADLTEFVASLPEGMDTDLSEGTRLSGGQRQRLGIARALIRDPRLLILDEPTASLDSRTEAHILETLRRAARGRTTVLITHRLNTARFADEIWVMEAGSIVERGTHETLTADPDSRYAHLWSLYRGPLAPPDSTDAPASSPAGRRIPVRHA